MSMKIPKHILKQLAGMSEAQVNDHIQTLQGVIDDIYTEKAGVYNQTNLFKIGYELVTNHKGELLYNHMRKTIEGHTKGIALKINEVSDEAFLPKLLAVWEKYRKAASMIRDILIYLDENYVDKNNQANHRTYNVHTHHHTSSSSSTTATSTTTATTTTTNNNNSSGTTGTHYTHPHHSLDKNNNLIGVYQQGIFIFRNEVLIKLTDRVQRLMLDMIRRERDGTEMTDRFLLRNLTQMMVEVDKDEVYIKSFERSFLDESHRYYANEASDFFEKNSAVHYLQRVQTRLREEVERADRCLDPDTKVKVEDVIKEEMIEKYKELVVRKDGSGVLVMLDNKYESQLRLVFDVLSLVDKALEPTIEIVRDYVTQQGLAIVTPGGGSSSSTTKAESSSSGKTTTTTNGGGDGGEDGADGDKDFMAIVNGVIDLRVYYDRLLLTSFSRVTKDSRMRDIEFTKAIKEAFDCIVNKNSRFPEYLSLLLDRKLKKGKKQVEDDQLDAFFDNVIMVFRHVKEKDVFEKYFKDHLSQRLLEERSASDDAEKLFLTKLKAEFGFQFTSKLEGMFKDMKVSKELMDEWKQYRDRLSSAERPSIDLSVQVLTHGFWPMSSTARCEFPEKSLIDSTNIFTKFYIEKHSGRKLTWQYNMGTADIVANGYAQTYTFTVSSYQMAILLLFNENEQLSLSAIHDLTKIPLPDIKKHIIQLCKAADEESKKLSKLLLFKSEGSGEGDEKKRLVLSATTVFTPNSAFKSKKIKHNLSPPMGVEDAAKKKSTDSKIEEERQWVVDATIVRIMKTRKTMVHNELMLEATQQLQSRFMPSPALIKKRIENLIERDYLERSPDNRTLYNYRA